MNKLIMSLIALTAFNVYAEPLVITITKGTVEELPIVSVNGTNYQIQQLTTTSVFNGSTQIQETSPGLKSPYIGAFTGNQVDQTINGIRMNNSLFRSGPNQYYSWIPDSFTRSVGITNGGNVGGTINRELGVNSSHIGGSFDSAIGWTESGSYKTDKLGIGFSGTDFGNVKTADGTVPHSSYNQKAIMGEANWNENNKSVFVYSNSSDLNRTDKWNGGYRISGYQKPVVYTWLDQSYANFTHKMTYDKLHINFGYQKFSETILDKTTLINTDLNQYTVNGEYFLSHGFSLYAANTVEDIRYDNGINPSGSNYNPRISNDLYTTTKQGIRWTGNTGPIDTHLSVGVKEIQATDVANFVDPEGSVILGYKGFFTSFDSSVNPPSYTNLKQSQTTGRGTSITNPNLTEERANTIRFGYASNGVYVDVYKKFFSNVINTQIVAANTYKPVNVGSAEITGGTIGYKNTELFDTQFGLNARIEVTDGEISKIAGGFEPITKVAPMIGYVKLNYNSIWTEFKYQPNDTSLSYADLDDVRTYNHTQGYKIVNIGYTNKFKQLDYTIALNNLLDNNGRVMGSAIDIPGRSAMLKLQYNF